MTCQILRSVLGVCITERNQGFSVKGWVVIMHSKAPRKGRYQNSALPLAATLGAGNSPHPYALPATYRPIC